MASRKSEKRKAKEPESKEPVAEAAAPDADGKGNVPVAATAAPDADGKGKESAAEATTPAKDEKDKESAGSEIRVREREEKKLAWRTFPGPKDASAVLRVAMDKATYAQITAHAAASVDAEICGILAGTQCEDDDGAFLEVSAAVRGDTARGGSTHVTFTHETWDVIHRTMEKDHPKLQIVGWYHSHPGFGVEFSEMDIFIQKNFFKANTQIAMVVDPLGGQTAMCLDTSDGIRYLDRFWVDGREHSCKMPKRTSGSTTTTKNEKKPKDKDKTKADEKDQSQDSEDEKDGASEENTLGDNPSVGELVDAIRTMQTRMAQAIQASDDQRAWIYRAVLAFGMLICTTVIVYVGWSIWHAYKAPAMDVADIWSKPILVGDTPMVLGLRITQVKAGQEVLEELLERRRAFDAALQQAPSQPGATPATGPSSGPPLRDQPSTQMQPQPSPASPTTAPAH